MEESMAKETKRVRDARLAHQKDPTPATAKELLAAKDASGWSAEAEKARAAREGSHEG
jgi:hypothetical protein